MPNIAALLSQLDAVTGRRAELALQLQALIDTCPIFAAVVREEVR